MLQGELEAYSRVLDLKEGVLRRELIWVSPTGRRTKLRL